MVEDINLFDAFREIVLEVQQQGMNARVASIAELYVDDSRIAFMD
jgi:hypothetical protein